jgi:hypothetical protein
MFVTLLGIVTLVMVRLLANAEPVMAMTGMPFVMLGIVTTLLEPVYPVM